MARVKIISDTEVLGIVRGMMAAGGDRAVSFGAVAAATGLAPSTLVQRFTTVGAMRAAAVRAAWQGILDATDAVLQGSADKGPQGLLRALDPITAGLPSLLASAPDAEARDMAARWRMSVVSALAARLGQGEKAREAACILFAAWQGQVLWGTDDFRLKDAVKRLS